MKNEYAEDYAVQTELRPRPKLEVIESYKLDMIWNEVNELAYNNVLTFRSCSHWSKYLKLCVIDIGIFSSYGINEWQHHFKDLHDFLLKSDWDKRYNAELFSIPQEYFGIRSCFDVHERHDVYRQTILFVDEWLKKIKDVLSVKKIMES